MDQRPSKPAEMYRVAWLCALAKSEMVAAAKMLDAGHSPAHGINPQDHNSYMFGEINGHNIVLACMDPGLPGKVSSHGLVTRLKMTFCKISIFIFVGIGGGVPRMPTPENPLEDVRLGDVVIGWAEEPGAPSVKEYDLGRDNGEGAFQITGQLDKPDKRVLNGLNIMLVNQVLKADRFLEHLQRLRTIPQGGFEHPGRDKDILFEAAYSHVAQHSGKCDKCDLTRAVKRERRVSQDPVFHQGTILSGDSAMRNALRRDTLSREHNHAKCFDMEAAGASDDTHCLVIRGICDYADSHSNSKWVNYAAGTAAAFARELLYILQPVPIEQTNSERRGRLDSFPLQTSVWISVLEYTADSQAIQGPALSNEQNPSLSLGTGRRSS